MRDFFEHLSSYIDTSEFPQNKTISMCHNIACNREGTQALRKYSGEIYLYCGECSDFRVRAGRYLYERVSFGKSIN